MTLTTMCQLTDLATTAVTSAVAAAWPHVGSGIAAKAAMDAAALDACEAVLRSHPGGVRALLSEGPRDGSAASKLQEVVRADVYACLDAVDGTQNGVLGGPRSFSAVTLDPCPPGRLVGSIADGASALVFSDVNEDTVATSIAVIADLVRDPNACVAGLNRPDTWNLLGVVTSAPAQPDRVGSRTGHLPNVQIGSCTLVGDASITLPWEADVVVGRVGFVEGVLAQRLDPTLTVIPVSGRGFKADPVRYVTDLSRAIARHDASALEAQVAAEEREALGFSAGEGRWGGYVLGAIEVGWLSPAAVMTIGSLTGTADPELPGLRRALGPVQRSSATGALTIETLVARAGSVEAGVVQVGDGDLGR